MSLSALSTALGLLTRFPLPTPAPTAAPPDLSRALIYFPAVGALLGACQALLVAALPGLPAAVLAVLAVALGAGLTGGLHLDGLADCFDGLGGGRGNPQRMLEIMHDSRIGAHGAAALGLLLAAKVAALSSLLQTPQPLWLWLGAPLMARWAVLPLMLYVRNARPGGLGAAFASTGRPAYLVAATAPAAALWAGAPAAVIPCACVATAAAATMAGWMRARLGGLTGDVYGACIEVAEVAFWVTASWA